MVEDILTLCGTQPPATNEVACWIYDHVEATSSIQKVRHWLLMVRTVNRVHAGTVHVVVNRLAKLGGFRFAIVPGYAEVCRMLELRL